MAKDNTMPLLTERLRPSDSCVCLEDEPDQRQRMKLSTLTAFKPTLPDHMLREKQKRKKSTLVNWLLMLPWRKVGDKCNRKSTLVNWLPMLPGIEAG